jgi:hypothetical protein
MSKKKWYSKAIHPLIALALVLSLGIVAVPMAGTAEAAGEVTFFSEYFEGGLPGDWVVVNNGGACIWDVDNPMLRPPLGGCSGLFMLADSEACGPGTSMDTELLTPPIDCSAYSTVRLEFDHHFEPDSVDTGLVDVWDGTAWVNKLHYTAVMADGHVSIDLSDDAAGRTGVQIRWYYQVPMDGQYWEVDNVEISGTESSAPPPPPPPEEEALISEEIEAGLPAAWQASGGWRTDNPENRTAGGGCSGVFMIADCAVCPNATMDAELVTPVVDCSAYDALRLEFNHMFNCVGNETADVDVWNGTAWVNLLSFGGVSCMGAVALVIVNPLLLKHNRPGFNAAPGIAPLGAEGDSGIKIKFHYHGASGNSSGFWEVDNVRLSGVPPPPVGGEARPVNKPAVLAPWIALCAVIMAGAGIVLRRRRAQS